MKRNKLKYLVGDFETTVYDNQEKTEVWASAVVEFYTEKVEILHSIDETFEYLVNLDSNIIIYYHNLKFDGHFWLDFLLRQKNLKLSCSGSIENEDFTLITNKKEMENNTYTYMISDMGQWYSIVIKINNHTIEIRDSLKLIPFSVSELSQAFNTKHKKLTMEYVGYRYAGCEITEEEKQYIANDVLVVKEALEIMYIEGHTKLTIGSCCLEEYKKLWHKPTREFVDSIDYIPLSFTLDFRDAFPDLSKFEIDEKLYGSKNAEEYIRKSYHGGWCYLVAGKENTVVHNGVTLDVNSLYPSMMHSESGNKFPYGYPTFYKGYDYGEYTLRPNPKHTEGKYYFVRIKCNFELKREKLPTIQIKGNPLYKSTEWLTTSRIKGKDGKYHKYYRDMLGIAHSSRVELTMTCTDFEQFLKHYDVSDYELLDYCVFNCESGIFDDYINKYKKIKIESTGAKRTLSKLYLNNLYGKMATSLRNVIKVASLGDDGIIHFTNVRAEDKEPIYIPVGSAITSYARNFTIKAAQINYHGTHKGFIYADTDSIHCDLPLSKIRGVELDDTAFCKWKCESKWDKAIFARQKTYIEHIIAEEEYNDIKCAGMPKRCKDILNEKFESGELDYSDFKTGLKVYGKLIPKRIKGGIVLQETTFEMK